MTLEEINALTLDNVLNELISRIEDISGFPEPYYTLEGSSHAW